MRDVPVLRFLELQVGYGTYGYEPSSGPGVEPPRRVYYGVGINFSRVLGDTVFRCALKGGRIQNVTDTILEFIQIPATDFLTYSRL